MNLLTLARNLTRRKARERSDLFVVEGVRAVEELLSSSLTVRGAIVAPQLARNARGAEVRELLERRGIASIEVTERDLASAADTDASQGVLAIAAVPERDWDGVSVSGDCLRILVLDGIQDPGNVGTILRTAAALGVQATVAMPGTVDLWNAKVVRSAMGALFHHPAFATTWEAFDNFRVRKGVTTWGADVGGEPIERKKSRQPPPDRLALVVGNEGHGLTPAARERLDATVSIPIAGVESLNVAVVTGILLYELGMTA